MGRVIWKYDLSKHFIHYQKSNYLNFINYFVHLFKKTKKKVYPKVKGEEKIYTKNTNEDYFDKFRNKEKLRTKAEQILEKDEKK